MKTKHPIILIIFFILLTFLIANPHFQAFEDRIGDEGLLPLAIGSTKVLVTNPDKWVEINDFLIGALKGAGITIILFFIIWLIGKLIGKRR